MKNLLLLHCAVLCCCFVALGTGCATFPRTASKSYASFQPTAAEREVAVALAEGAIAERKLRTASPLYVTNVDLVRDKADDAESEERLAMVTHYRYEGDLAIQTLVNLTEKKVVSLESIPHLPTPLVAQEFSLARELALSRADVKQALEEYRDRLNVEALVVRTASEDDPLFGHRVVRLLFRVGQDYLSTPIVMVDLTEKKVIIQQPPSRTN